ncbi:transcription factor bHLH110-like [Rutidosis leptorrhynchoides]|uniref:transcription factor bHLH110-like n=1 Tax=Rutidosis leptorrhynchoides TaxID=125765 RepID=UPI003A9953CF
MESSYFHQQQEEHQLEESSSFSWSQNPILNGSNNNINSRNLTPFFNNSTNSMVQDLGLPYNGMGYPIENFVTQELQRLARIKDEFSVEESYPKFLDLLNCSPTLRVEDLHLHPNYSNYMKNYHDQLEISNINNNQDSYISNGYQMIKGGQHLNDHQNSTNSNGTFSQIHPDIKVTSLNQITSSNIHYLPALDHFGSPRFEGSFSPHWSLNANNLGCYGRTHQPNQRASAVCPSKISSVSKCGSTDLSAKRPASKYNETKETQMQSKKSKSEARSSSAPFQVRKEKLGDRIAAIQQLVAPFGKTDTASVLMEAIGYIKFLQTQVETLSVPYMKSTDKIGGLSSQEGRMEDGYQEAKRDLRSRGLCLMPLSYLSYVSDGGEGIWPTS